MYNRIIKRIGAGLMAIRSAAEMQLDIPVAEDDAIIDDIEDYYYEHADTEESNGNYYFKLSDEYKSASRILKSKDSTDAEKSDALAVMKSEADKGDAFAAYKLGKIYFKGEYMPADYVKAEEYLSAAVADNNRYAMYQLAKLYMTAEKYDIKKAVELFEAVADKNMWASYWLGRIYLFGRDGIAPDKEKAVEWLTKSASDGNEYAEKLLNYDGGHNYMISNTIVNLLVDLGRFIEEDHACSRRKMSMKVDKKLQRMIQKKKQELGIKSDGMDMHYEY